MTPTQAKAARNLLGWSRDRLGAMSGISVNTISRYERHGYLTRTSHGMLGAAKLAAVQAALESAGVVFIQESGDAPGVWLRQVRNVTAHAVQAAPTEAGSITPIQVKAARGLLQWSRLKLAGRSGTTYHLIKIYEQSGQVAGPYLRMAQDDPLVAIRVALDAAGVEFIDGDMPGVRLRKPQDTL